MITNLFLSFDPSTNIFYLNWIRSFLGLIFIPFIYWFIPSRWNILWTLIIINLHKEFNILFKKNNNKGRTLIFIRLFSIIIFNNFLGLFPYIFTRSRHIIINLSLALPLWVTFIFYGWINNINHIFTHLVPQGTPSVLMPFIVCIETIRNIIRPGTLAVRLTANIIAGHLLITLLGNTGPSLRILIINFLIIVQLLLILLEIAVAIIQSYVFSILRTLYSREVNYVK